MLVVDGLSAGYGASSVLFGVSFEVRAGEIVVLLGRNGMGKSSILRSIVRLADPAVTGGRIQFRDHDILGLDAGGTARLGMGYVPQGRRIFRSLTVEETLSVAARRGRRSPNRWPTAELFRIFPRLKERRRSLAGTLSGGEQQMLAIARALSLDPEFLILDEPTEGLSPAIVTDVGGLIERVRRESGLTVLLAEQNVRFAVRLADRVEIVEKGKIVAQSNPDELGKDSTMIDRFLGLGV